MKVNNLIRTAFAAALLTVLQGCVKGAPEPGVVIMAKPAAVPVGAEEKCWQEPKVAYEQNGPGLDAKGEYYHPHYTAVREVKMGRWVPCKR